MAAQKKLKDYYSVLGVSIEATDREVKKAYFALAKDHHPDRISDPEKKKEAHSRFIGITQAYQVLSDKQRRSEYNGLYYEHFATATQDSDVSPTPTWVERIFAERTYGIPRSPELT